MEISIAELLREKFHPRFSEPTSPVQLNLRVLLTDDAPRRLLLAEALPDDSRRVLHLASLLTPPSFLT